MRFPFPGGHRIAQYEAGIFANVPAKKLEGIGPDTDPGGVLPDEFLNALWGRMCFEERALAPRRHSGHGDR